MEFVLASGSPRRRDLLSALGVAFDVVVPDVDETPAEGEDPIAYVSRIAEAKAGVGHRPGTLTIAADTTVVLDEEILGKPTDDDDAAAMLGRLSGRTHLVHTAVAGRTDHATALEVASANVRIATLDERSIRRYVATGEPHDKAGAYGLQGIGGLFVEGIVGEASTVVGLPLSVLRRVVMALGVDLLDRVAR